MEIQKNTHYKEIDIMRGIAIILVVIGHSSPEALVESNPLWFQMVYRFIYLFHMPLFFWISGFCFFPAYNNSKSFQEKKMVVLNKVKRLAIPYFFYSFITLILKLIFAQYANNPFEITQIYKILYGQNPNGGLWFLWILFVMTIVLLFINKWNIYFVLVMTFIMKLGTTNWSINNNLVQQLCVYSVFFVLGMVIRKNYEKLINLKKMGIWVAFICYGITLLLSLWQVKPMIVVIAAGMIGIIGTWMLSSHLVKSGKNIVMVSEYSMDIYLLSYFVQVPIRVVYLNFIPIPYIVTLLMMIVLGGIAPIFISKYMIRKNRLLSLLLLGRNK